MFIVIFEVEPRAGRFDDYLAVARGLKPKLEAMPGFIDNERFRGTRDPGRILSLSTWADEKAVVRWRIQAAHHGAQERGRSEIFADYHLRVGEITADTHPPAGASLAQSRFDATEAGQGKAATVTELMPAENLTLADRADELLAELAAPSDEKGRLVAQVFAGITTPGKLALLATWRDAEAASAWSPVKPDPAAWLRHRQVRVIRDYGMFERREAPQFYPDRER